MTTSENNFFWLSSAKEKNPENNWGYIQKNRIPVSTGKESSMLKGEKLQNLVKSLSNIVTHPQVIGSSLPLSLWHLYLPMSMGKQINEIVSHKI